MLFGCAGCLPRLFVRGCCCTAGGKVIFLDLPPDWYGLALDLRTTEGKPFDDICRCELPFDALSLLAIDLVVELSGMLDVTEAFRTALGDSVGVVTLFPDARWGGGRASVDSAPFSCFCFFLSASF